MKQYVMTPLAIALAGFTLAANAQSSVTLYGIIDAGIGYVHNADGNKKQVGMINGNMNGNRWGIKGSEDLGGGLKAVFQLESGFDPGTGRLNQGGREFGRQAFVGLTSDKYGTLTLGRQYDPLVDMVQGITGDNFFGGIFATPGDVDNYDNSLRTSNAVKYVSPTYAGFQVEGLYGFSNGAGTTGQGQTWSGAATYNNGPVSLAAGYFYANNPTASRTTGWNSTSSDSLFNSPVNNGYSTAHSIGIARVAGQYVFGSATVGISYSNARYSPDGKSGFSETEKYNIGNVFAAYQLTPALLVGAGYTYMKASGDTSASYHQASLGADYALSKRTDFYAMAAYQHANGTQSVYDATTGRRTTQAAQASIGSYGYAGTSHQEIAIVGIRHKF
jgi:predicted porin